MLSSRKRNYSLTTLQKPKASIAKEYQTNTKQGNFLPTIRENKQVQKLHAKQLGLTIQRFQNLMHVPIEQVGEQEMIRSLFNAIRKFADVENNFRGFFYDGQALLKTFLFIDSGQLTRKYKIRQGLSFKQVCNLIDKQSSEQLAQENLKYTQLQKQKGDEIASLKADIDAQQIEIFDLKKEVQRYRQLANVEYVVSLQKRIVDLKELVSTQQQEYKGLVLKNEDLSADILQLQKQVAELQWKSQQLQQKLYHFKVYREKTEIYLLKLRQRFDDVNSKMVGLKQIIEKVQKQNENLTSQRTKLVNRAAVSFTDLTPRPKYEKMFQYDKQTNINPTSQIMQILISQWKGQTKTLFQKYFKAKRNRKLVQIQAIREKTMQEIKNAKSQLQNIIAIEKSS